MEIKRLALFAFLSAVLALPLGGFVFGFMSCEDCGFNLFGRAFVGLVFAVLTPLSGGFPPRNEGGVGAPFNAWPHIVITWAILSAWMVHRARKKLAKKGPAQPPGRRERDQHER